MIARELPRAEWGRLKGPGVPELSYYAKPSDLKVAVVETDGQIVAQCVIARLTHLEGLQINPEHRNAGVGGALLRQISQSSSEWLAHSTAIAGAADGDERMYNLLARLGARRLALQFFALDLGA